MLRKATTVTRKMLVFFKTTLPKRQQHCSKDDNKAQETTTLLNHRFSEIRDGRYLYVNIVMPGFYVCLFSLLCLPSHQEHFYDFAHKPTFIYQGPGQSLNSLVVKSCVLRLCSLFSAFSILFWGWQGGSIHTRDHGVHTRTHKQIHSANDYQMFWSFC